MNRRNYIVADLTLSEYDGFSERELKEMLHEEKRKMYGAEPVGTKITPDRINAFREVLLKSVVGRAIKMKGLQSKTS
jgi:hypothetical protein